MAKYTWCSDVHFEFLQDDQVLRFSEEVAAIPSDGILITGDISVSQKLVYHLSVFEKAVQRPIIFVLGNHDFWGSNFEKVHKNMHGLDNMSQFLKYCPERPYLPVTPTTCVLGHDGWYDASYGNWKTSTALVSDWQSIYDFLQKGGNANIPEVVNLAKAQSIAGATFVMNSIKSAVRYHKHLCVLTHVPPFPQVSQNDENLRPWYVSKFMGDCLEAAARAYPQVNFTVLCGHAHNAAEFKPMPNMVVRCAAATHGKPQIAGVIDLP